MMRITESITSRMSRLRNFDLAVKCPLIAVEPLNGQTDPFDSPKKIVLRKVVDCVNGFAHGPIITACGTSPNGQFSGPKNDRTDCFHFSVANSDVSQSQIIMCETPSVAHNYGIDSNHDPQHPRIILAGVPIIGEIRGRERRTIGSCT